MAFDIQARLNLTGPFPSAQQMAQQIQQQLNGITATVNLTLPQGSVAQVNQVNQAMTSTTTAAQQLNTQLAATGNSANQLSSKIAPANTALVSLNATSRASIAQLKQLQGAAQSTGAEFGSFAEQIGYVTKRFAAYTVAATAIITFAQSIRSGIADAINFQNELVKLSQIGENSATNIRNIANSVTELSQKYGVASKELVESAVVLRQAGLNARDTAIALETLAQAATSPNFDTFARNTQGAIAVLNQFKLGVGDLNRAFSSINAVAADFPVAARDIQEAVVRTGGTFAALGGNLNEFIALFTSVKSVTQESSEAIATGLRNIFTRLQSESTLDTLREFRINLRYTAEEARALGNIDLTNQFVGVPQAIKRIQDSLKDLPATDPRYARIVDAIGGTRQIGRALPLISQQGANIQQQALNTANLGGSSLAQASERGLASLSRQAAQTAEKFQELFRTITNSEGFNSLANGLLRFGGFLADVVKLLTPAIPLFVTLASIKFGENLFNFASAAGPLKQAKKFASGGYSSGGPSLLTPGEMVVPPANAARAGYSNLRKLNSGGIFDNANGFMVPGVGNQDSELYNLAPGSFVIRKSSVERIQKRGYGDLITTFNKPNNLSEDNFEKLVTKYVSNPHFYNEHLNYPERDYFGNIKKRDVYGKFLNDVLLSNQLTKSTELYRGSGLDTLRGIESYNNIDLNNISESIGSHIVLPAFTSTSKNRNGAQHFNTGLSLRILANKGLPGLDISNSFGLTHEKEVLLPKNSQFRILDNQKYGNFSDYSFQQNLILEYLQTGRQKFGFGSNEKINGYSDGGEPTIRLYRSGLLPNESKKYAKPGTKEFNDYSFLEQAMAEKPQGGRFFSDNLESIPFYMRHNELPAKYLDVKKSIAEQYHITKSSADVQELSRDLLTEHYLPEELANQAQLLDDPKDLSKLIKLLKSEKNSGGSITKLGFGSISPVANTFPVDEIVSHLGEARTLYDPRTSFSKTAIEAAQKSGILNYIPKESKILGSGINAIGFQRPEGDVLRLQFGIKKLQSEVGSGSVRDYLRPDIPDVLQNTDEIFGKYNNTYSLLEALPFTPGLADSRTYDKDRKRLNLSNDDLANYFGLIRNLRISGYGHKDLHLGNVGYNEGQLKVIDPGGLYDLNRRGKPHLGETQQRLLAEFGYEDFPPDFSKFVKGIPDIHIAATSIPKFGFGDVVKSPAILRLNRALSYLDSGLSEKDAIKAFMESTTLSRATAKQYIRQAKLSKEPTGIPGEVQNISSDLDFSIDPELVGLHPFEARRKQQSYLREARISQAAELLKSGKSSKDIIAQLKPDTGLAASTIRNYIREAKKQNFSLDVPLEEIPPWELSRQELQSLANRGVVGPAEYRNLTPEESAAQIVNNIVRGEKPIGAFSQLYEIELAKNAGLKLKEVSEGVTAAYIDDEAYNNLHRAFNEDKDKPFSRKHADIGKALGYSPNDIAAFYAANDFRLYNEARNIPKNETRLTDLSFSPEDLEEFNKNKKPTGFALGGLSPLDKIPALLTPGEFVFSPETVSRLGVSNLDRVNKGGTVDHIRGYNRGGYVKGYAEGDEIEDEDDIYKLLRKNAKFGPKPRSKKEKTFKASEIYEISEQINQQVQQNIEKTYEPSPVVGGGLTAEPYVSGFPKGPPFFGYAGRRRKSNVDYYKDQKNLIQGTSEEFGFAQPGQNSPPSASNTYGTQPTNPAVFDLEALPPNISPEQLYDLSNVGNPKRRRNPKNVIADGDLYKINRKREYGDEDYYKDSRNAIPVEETDETFRTGENKGSSTRFYGDKRRGQFGQRLPRSLGEETDINAERQFAEANRQALDRAKNQPTVQNGNVSLTSQNFKSYSGQIEQLVNKQITNAKLANTDAEKQLLINTKINDIRANIFLLEQKKLELARQESFVSSVNYNIGRGKPISENDKKQYIDSQDKIASLTNQINEIKGRTSLELSGGEAQSIGGVGTQASFFDKLFGKGTGLEQFGAKLQGSSQTLLLGSSYAGDILSRNAGNAEDVARSGIGGGTYITGRAFSQASSFGGIGLGIGSSFGGPIGGAIGGIVGASYGAASGTFDSSRELNIAKFSLGIERSTNALTTFVNSIDRINKSLTDSEVSRIQEFTGDIYSNANLRYNENTSGDFLAKTIGTVGALNPLTLPYSLGLNLYSGYQETQQGQDFDVGYSRALRRNTFGGSYLPGTSLQDSESSQQRNIRLQAINRENPQAAGQINRAIEGFDANQLVDNRDLTRDQRIANIRRRFSTEQLGLVATSQGVLNTSGSGDQLERYFRSTQFTNQATATQRNLVFSGGSSSTAYLELGFKRFSDNLSHSADGLESLANRANDVVNLIGGGTQLSRYSSPTNTLNTPIDTARYRQALSSITAGLGGPGQSLSRTGNIVGQLGSVGPEILGNYLSGGANGATLESRLLNRLGVNEGTTESAVVRNVAQSVSAIGEGDRNRYSNPFQREQLFQSELAKYNQGLISVAQQQERIVNAQVQAQQQLLNLLLKRTELVGRTADLETEQYRFNAQQRSIRTFGSPDASINDISERRANAGFYARINSAGSDAGINERTSFSDIEAIARRALDGRREAANNTNLPAGQRQEIVAGFERQLISATRVLETYAAGTQRLTFLQEQLGLSQRERTNRVEGQRRFIQGSDEERAQTLQDRSIFEFIRNSGGAEQRSQTFNNLGLPAQQAFLRYSEQFGNVRFDQSSTIRQESDRLVSGTLPGEVVNPLNQEQDRITGQINSVLSSAATANNLLVTLNTLTTEQIRGEATRSNTEAVNVLSEQIRRLNTFSEQQLAGNVGGTAGRVLSTVAGTPSFNRAQNTLSSIGYNVNSLSSSDNRDAISNILNTEDSGIVDSSGVQDVLSILRNIRGRDANVTNIRERIRTSGLPLAAPGELTSGTLPNFPDNPTDEDIQRYRTALGLASGGMVYANQGFFQPRGTDTVPAMLTPGEMVVNATSTAANRDLLERINNAKGPVYRANGGIAYLAEGGTVPFAFENSVNDSWSALLQDLRVRQGPTAVDNVLNTLGAPGAGDPIFRFLSRFPNLDNSFFTLRSSSDLQQREIAEQIQRFFNSQTNRIRETTNTPIGRPSTPEETAAYEAIRPRTAAEIANRRTEELAEIAAANAANSTNPESDLFVGPGETTQLIERRLSVARAASDARANAINEASAQRQRNFRGNLAFSAIAASDPFSTIGIQADINQYGGQGAAFNYQANATSNLLRQQLLSQTQTTGLFGTGFGGTLGLAQRQQQAQTYANINQRNRQYLNQQPFTNRNQQLLSYLRGARRYATGGMVEGDDTVPAFLSEGEFVMNRAATRNIGANNLYNLQRFASGGVVGNVSNSSGNVVGQSAVASIPDSQELISALSSFSRNNQELVEALQAFPHSIEINATHKVDVIINGLAAFQTMEETFKELVVAQVDESIQTLIKDKFPSLQ